MKADNVGLLVQAGRAEDATKTYMMPWLWAESQGIVAGVQEQSHFVNVTPRTVVPEDLMWGRVPPSGIYSSFGEDAVTGSVADTNTLGPQTPSPPMLQTQPHFAPGAQQLATIPQYVFPHGSGIGQRQQPIPCEDAQALIAGGPVFGTNRTADPITLGAFGGIVGDSWTGTLWWQREREGPWSHVQAVATDGVRNPCVYSFVRCKQWKVHSRAECSRYGRAFYRFGSLRPSYPFWIFKRGCKRPGLLWHGSKPNLGTATNSTTWSSW